MVIPTINAARTRRLHRAKEREWVDYQNISTKLFNGNRFSKGNRDYIKTA